ncbi:MAG: hypothetical protein WAT19_02785 [Ferruginibacter sp.]
MKKYLLLFAISAGLSLGAVAQNEQGKDHGKSHNKEKKEKHNDDNHGEYDDNGGQQKHGSKNHDNNRGGKYAKNAPAKVREAFNRDFPNATAVSWTKNRNIWTASFSGSIFGTRQASYTANGTRVNKNSTSSSKRKTGIFGTRNSLPGN